MSTSFCQSERTLTKLPSREIPTNALQGKYRPRFFDLEEFGISRVEINSCYYQKADAESEIIKSLFSFAYLREDKLRTIIAYDLNNQVISFEKFLAHFRMTIESSNLFRTSKYLSRVFRPVRYGAFFRDLDIHINENHNGKQTDGISLISVELAKTLGMATAEEGMSCQFTAFTSLGLTKGHCLISERINHDVVIYGMQNIKTELRLGSDLQYLALEPVKLGTSLRMDIQSLINLWPIFGSEQYLQWSSVGIQQYISDLTTGKLNKWLDNFDLIDSEDYDSEAWVLRRAIWKGIDYRKFPGLMRAAWTNFRTSIRSYSTNQMGEPIFRIPVPGGHRGYLRVDLRSHNENGDFDSTVNSGTALLDKYGNLWISKDDVESFTSITGGSDFDDCVAVIPVEDNKAVLFRNPNAHNEYVIYKMEYEGVSPQVSNRIIGQTLTVNIQEKKARKVEEFSSGNKLFEKFLSGLNQEPAYFIDYNKANLLRTLIKIRANQTNIGTVCNAEMIRSASGITNTVIQKKLMKQFNWSIENTVDATVKEGKSCEEDLANVSDMFTYLAENKIKISKSLLQRIPESRRNQMQVSEQHPLDQLLEAINLLIDKADRDVLGSGSANRGNRIPGIIDRCDIPLIELGASAINNPLSDLAMTMMKGYNREIAILLERTKDGTNKEFLRSEGIESAQITLLNKLDGYSQDERSLIVNTWAFEIYKSAGYIHDSILFISSKDSLQGTSEDMLHMLANNGQAYNISTVPTMQRNCQVREAITTLKSIRVWHQQILCPNDFVNEQEIIIETKTALLGSSLLNLGDEVKIPDGIYKIKQIASSVSRRDSRILKNSLTIYLNA